MTDPADILVVVKGKDTRRQLRMKLDRAEARLAIAVNALTAVENAGRTSPYGLDAENVSALCNRALQLINAPGTMGNET